MFLSSLSANSIKKNLLSFQIPIPSFFSCLSFFSHSFWLQEYFVFFLFPFGKWVRVLNCKQQQLILAQLSRKGILWRTVGRCECEGWRSRWANGPHHGEVGNCNHSHCHTMGIAWLKGCVTMAVDTLSHTAATSVLDIRSCCCHFQSSQLLCIACSRPMVLGSDSDDWAWIMQSCLNSQRIELWFLPKACKEKLPWTVQGFGCWASFKNNPANIDCYRSTP